MEPPANYFPLWQSLVGALGAFAVAAFTVAVTNRQTNRREQAKDSRSRHMARVTDLKNRLDDCTDLVSTAFRSSTGSARRAIIVASAGPSSKPPLSYDVPDDDHFALMNQAITRAELHFPTLVDPLKGLSTALMALETLATEGAAGATADVEKWKKEEMAPYVARFQKALVPAIDRRQAVINEARRLLVNDFDMAP